jgi:tetrahydromethanopterin S-methyltransferase subunit B
MTRKRKSSKQSPGEEKQIPGKRREHKQRNTMNTGNGHNTNNNNGIIHSQNSQYQTSLTPQAQCYSSGSNFVYPQSMSMASSPYPGWGSVTPGMTQGGQVTHSSPGTVSNDIVQMLIKRLDSMDSKLARLDSIHSSVDSINLRIQKMETKINDLDSKVRDIERSREFDSQTLCDINKQQKDLDSYIQKLEAFERDHKDTESVLKAEIQDLRCRSMRDNLLFHKIPEEKDENCEKKILQFVQEKLKVDQADQIRLQRAHRLGPYKSGKVRPIVVKFTDFPEREKVRRAAKELKGTDYGISEQFPKEVVEQRRKLIPIMLKARREGKEAYLKIDKLFINNQEYRGPC